MSEYPFDHIITKLRTTRGSPFARRVMDEAADEIERLQAKIDRTTAQVEEWETMAARPLNNPACDWAATHAAQIRTALRGGE